MTLHPTKQEIRQHMRERKAMLTTAEREAAAATVFAAVERTEEFKSANRILVYHSLPDELSTIGFINKWEQRKQLFLPRVNGEDLELLPYSRTSLHTGAFRIKEPDGTETADPDTMELIIVPAVALDPKGNRLGRGKGFYDRLLARTDAATIGVAYNFQLVDSIPVEPHDKPLDIVITQSRIIRAHDRHPKQNLF